MNKEGLTKFLTKRGYEVLQVEEQRDGFHVYLKDRAKEATTMFSSLEEKTPVFFSEIKPSLIKRLWNKIWRI